MSPFQRDHFKKEKIVFQPSFFPATYYHLKNSPIKTWPRQEIRLFSCQPWVNHLDSQGLRSTFRRRVVRRAFASKSESPKVSKLCQHGPKGRQDEENSSLLMKIYRLNIFFFGRFHMWISKFFFGGWAKMTKSFVGIFQSIGESFSRPFFPGKVWAWQRSKNSLLVSGFWKQL